MRTQGTKQDGDIRAGGKRGDEMLTKKQLLDAAQCCSECVECACEMVGYRYEHCIKATAQTALAYRAMLERLEWAGLTNSNCYYCAICGRRKEKGHQPDCELAALLKGSDEYVSYVDEEEDEESEVEEGRNTTRRFTEWYRYE